ncbi:MAG: PilZ domain-containing protein [Candidatus Omnitrophica bacterium]|nr:PilZ domain-containing protein [Candidatus Omnitrophota bacterium]
MWETFDKRKFPRLNVKCDVLVKEQNSSDIFTTETENIGAGGICVFLKKSLASYSPVSLKLELNDKETQPIECTGKVVWCIKNQTLNQDNTRFDVGIEFLSIKSEDRERIRRFIQNRITA